MDCKVCHFRICICSTGWKTFDANFEKIPELNISTITMCIKFTHVGLNFERIVNQFFQRQKKSPDTFTYALEYKQNKPKKNETKLITATRAQKVHKKKVEKGEQQMYNSINLKSYIPRNFDSEDKKNEIADLVCCKLFRNGSCNITGFKNMKQIVSYLHILMNYLKSFREDVFVYRDIVEYRNVAEIKITLKKKKKVLIYKNVPRVRVDVDAETKTVFRIQLKTVDQEYIYIEDIFEYSCQEENYEETLHAKISRGNVSYFQAKISMVNATFKFPLYVFQNKFSDFLSGFHYPENGPITRSDFDLDRKYNAVKIGYVSPNIEQTETTVTRKKIKKVSGELTISVFRTGSVTISGGTCSETIIDAFMFLNRIFDENKSILAYTPENFERAAIVKKKPKEKIRDIIKRIRNEYPKKSKKSKKNTKPN